MMFPNNVCIRYIFFQSIGIYTFFVQYIGIVFIVLLCSQVYFKVKLMRCLTVKCLIRRSQNPFQTQGNGLCGLPIEY
jgi:hypothetical protein